MTSSHAPIATVPIARSLPRLLILPAVGLAAGALAVGGGVLEGGLLGLLLAVAGAAATAFSLWLALILLTLRLEVEAGAIRIRWLGGVQRHHLARGPVTRISRRTGRSPRIRPRLGALGWAFGEALLRENERIHVLRLAPEAPLIVLPTDRGRLAVAPQVEDELLTALATSARVQQRLAQTLAAERERQRRAAAAAAAISAPPQRALEPAPRLLTGVERAMLEGRLIEERLARAAAEQVAREAEARAAAERAAAEAAEREAAAAAAAAASTTAPQRVGEATAPTRRPAVRVPRVPARRVWIDRLGLRLRVAAAEVRRRALAWSTLGWIAAALLPTIGAGIAWVIVSSGTPPAPSELRQIALALLLAGPAASVAILAARVAAPHLAGPLTAAGITAVLLVGRAVVG